MAVSLDSLEAAKRALRRERRRCVDEREAFRAFKREVGKLKATAPTASAASTPPLIGHQQATDGSLTRVRRAYERTVMSVPHYDEEYGDPFADSLAAEFGPDVAAAFQSATVFSPALRQTVASAATEAVADRMEFVDIVDGEFESVESMADEISTLCNRLSFLDDKPLSERSFNELLAVRENVCRLQTRVDELAATRQQTIADHRRELSSLVPDVAEYLYQDLSVRYPVLSTLAAVGETLTEALRRVERRLAATP
ncbi:hypothetical protein C453_06983 [Haloferax elongans ATCC BAA-1513]|uniref:DUF7260 domain-containing protein n=1 Tax=Haloferax elongans ATCC BAA-1513 TaxID=1230453 RepID=M0HLW3_HALEO|nr:hypothetical protein [Haloferax elongans]ELZ85540.1 hypothetical protein C453_06983 [Haloferax elongans ATCC BAA-1513]